MFKLNEKYEVIRNILECDYIRYSASKISTIKTAYSQKDINIPIKDTVFSLLSSYFDLNFDVLHAATNMLKVLIICLLALIDIETEDNKD